MPEILETLDGPPTAVRHRSAHGDPRTVTEVLRHALRAVRAGRWVSGKSEHDTQRRAYGAGEFWRKHLELADPSLKLTIRTWAGVNGWRWALGPSKRGNDDRDTAA